MVVIGDEILDGHTRDTNSGWLARRLDELGIPLERILTVPDDPGAITEALASEVARRRPRLVLSSGGIGSTPDDRTMEAVASFLGVTVRPHPQLTEEISRWTAQARAEGAAVAPGQERAMQKMTLVPEGSYLLAGTEGVLPGVAVDLDGGVGGGGVTIVVLPGIPTEFERIVDTGVRDLLAGFGRPEHIAELRHPYPESALSPVLDELVAAFPAVKVGSYPGRECLIRLKGPIDDVERAIARVRQAVEELAATEGARAMSDRWQAHWP